MASLEEIISNVFLLPLSNLISDIVSLLPQILITAFLVFITYLIAHYVSVIVRKILYNIKVDRLIRVGNLQDTFGATSLASIYSYLIKWSLFIALVQKIIETVGLGFLAGLVTTIVFWLAKLAFTSIVVVTGLVVIDFLTLRILESKNAVINTIIRVIRAVLIVILVFTSLEQLGLKLAIAENVFLMIIGAGLFAVSLALGIGFGLALKDEARAILRRFRKKLRY